MTDAQAKPVALEAARRMHNRYWTDILGDDRSRVYVLNRLIMWLAEQDQPWWKRALLRLKGLNRVLGRSDRQKGQEDRTQ